MTEAAAADRRRRESGDAAQPLWLKDPLGFLIEPMSRDAFLNRIYEREALVNIREEPDRYASLLTLADLDRFIASADLRDGMVDLASQRSRISRDDYVSGNGRISRSAVAEEYLRGATLILPHLHESLFDLGEFCRSLEEVFSCHVQTNVYLTPSGNQGFPIHYDNHDVFVLQIAGAKAWRLYDAPVATPYRGERFEPGRHEAGEATQAFTLQPGDCVYVPRGLMHDAENVGDAPSLHITVGLITKTWADLLLEAISELALSEPDFRRSLPAGYATRDFDRDQARRHFRRLIELVGSKAGMDGAFDLLADEFIRDRRPNLSGVIMAHPPVPQPQDRYRRRRFVPWNTAEDEGKLVLIGPGGDLEFSAEEEDALVCALSGEPFGVEDLTAPDPVGLIRRLWANGYLERISV